MSISHLVTTEPVKFNTAAINLREDILDIFWIADILDRRNV